MRKSFDAGPVKEGRVAVDPWWEDFQKREAAARAESLRKFREMINKEPIHTNDYFDKITFRYAPEHPGGNVWWGNYLETTGRWFGATGAYNEKATTVVEQIAVMLATGEKPEKILYEWYSRDSEPRSARDVFPAFDFADVEDDLLAAGRSLSPEFKDMTLEEIGQSLIKKRREGWRREGVEMFKGRLSEKPELTVRTQKYRDTVGDVEVFKREDSVEFDYGSGGREWLEQAGSAPGPWNSGVVIKDADPMCAQIAMMVATKGKPKKIKYVRTDHQAFRAHGDYGENASATMTFSEVENDILAAAQKLSPEYGSMPLEDIGRDLLAKKEAAKGEMAQ